MNDFDDMRDEWHAQQICVVDIDALRTEARKRGRRLRWALTNDLIGFALALGLGLWALMSGRVGIAPAVIIGLLALLLGFQAWSLWIRRRQLGDSGLDAMAMVELEIARARTSLRYWRVSIWLGLAMWLGVHGFAMLRVVSSPADGEETLVAAMFQSLWIGAVVGIGFAAWAWWLGRRTRSLLLRMQRVRDELQGLIRF